MVQQSVTLDSAGEASTSHESVHTARREIRWNWILSRRSDLTWFIGSALGGWTYAALVLILGSGLTDPRHDTLYHLSFTGISLPLTLELLILTSWMYFMDLPHLWATLSRTYLDPGEWSQRGRELSFSLVWFVAGPLVVFGPYLLGTLVSLTAAIMALGGTLFFAFFRAWGYYHIVRQHWGFLSLYKRRNGEISDALENHADFWFFNLSLYLPIAILLTSPIPDFAGSFRLPDSIFPDSISSVPGTTFWDFNLGVLSRFGILQVLHPVAVGLYVITIGGYILFQIVRWHCRVPRNGPKLLFLLSIVPLHFVTFLHPLLALFTVPIITTGHNLQYQRIVWMYGTNKYTEGTTRENRFTRPIYRHLWLYVFCAVLFAAWVGWLWSVEDTFAFYFDRWVFQGVGLLAGLKNPAEANVGAEVFSLFLTGWALQHYYLDGKIWQVSRDASVAKNLKVQQDAQ